MKFIIIEGQKNDAKFRLMKVLLGKEEAFKKALERDGFFNTEELIKELLNYWRIINYKINDNLVVDCDGDIWLSEKDLTKIPIKFGKGIWSFDCSHNPNLISLEGAPKEVKVDFWCSSNFNLTSPKGSPKKVGNMFDCTDNPNLISLEGIPEEVGSYFFVFGNPKLSKSEVEKAVKKYGKDKVKSDYVFESVEKFKVIK